MVEINTNINNPLRANIFTDGLSSCELSAWSDKIVCIVGPSGVGKTSLCKELLKEHFNNYHLLGSSTTRQRTSREIIDNNYIYLTEKEFKQLISNKAFFHWAKTQNGYYGLEKERIRIAVANSKRVLTIFRSCSADALKFALQKIQVIELRASLEILEQRILRRQRLELKSMDIKLRNVAKDLEQNQQFYEYWNNLVKGSWIQIDNNLEKKPISPHVVLEVKEYLLKGIK
jgi:guanylate kinase